MFPIKNGLKQGDALLSLPFNFALEYALGGFRQTRYTSSSGLCWWYQCWVEAYIL